MSKIDWKQAYAKLYAKHVDMTYTTFERCRACHGTGVDGLPAPEAPR